MDELAREVALMRQETTQMHHANQKHGAEVVTRLDRIDDKLGLHAERMSAVETLTAYLKDEWKLIRARYHEMVNARQTDGGDGLIVKRADLRWLIVVYASGIGTMYALARLLGKL